MKLIIDTDTNTVTRQLKDQHQVIDLYSPEAFRWISEQWLKTGWDQKYSYTFSWLGRPIIQLPEDMIRAQEVIFAVQPDVIVETGVAHGGSLVYYASLCRAMNKGRIIGVDIEIRPHNRRAIEAHFLSDLITLVEGDSTAADTIQRVRSLVEPGETVIVLLDSCHSQQHVLSELEVYGPLVSPGSYIVATDGIMADLVDVPRGKPTWGVDNPMSAAMEFAQQHPDFEIVQPAWPFSESHLQHNVTHWPNGWLRRKA